MNTVKLDELFADYEKAFNQLDIKKNAEFFSDSFISAGPKGIITQNKEEFLSKQNRPANFIEVSGRLPRGLFQKHLHL